MSASLRNALFGDWSPWVLAVLGAIAFMIPVLNLAVPTTSVFHLSAFSVTLVGKYLTYALLALSVDLVWGYCGILSLCHGAFFALGAYAMGMYLMRMVGDRGVYGNPLLPDFMVFLNWQELPWYWLGSNHFIFAIVMCVLAPGLLALLFGAFAFRARVNGVYFSIITQALTFALMLAFFRNEMGFGGNNGLTDFKEIAGFNIQSDATRCGLLVATVIVVAAGLLMCRAVVHSKLGKILISVREAESRARFLGYRVEHYKLFVWVLSACLAGLAGAAYVPLVGIINPSEFAPGNSIESVIAVAVGGRGTLVGGLIGGVALSAVRTWFTGAFPELWLFMLGTLFVLVTLFLPGGVMGPLSGIAARKAPPAPKFRPPASPDHVPAPVIEP